MSYSPQTFVADEQPTTAKWNLLWSNDASFNDGTGFADDILDSRMYVAGSIDPEHLASTVWGWEELGRTTLGVAGDTITVSSLTAKKYLRIFGTFLATGGTTSPQIIFNNDSTSANYNRRVSDNFAAGAASAGAALFLNDAASANVIFTETFVYNVAAQNKLIVSRGITDGGDGASPSTRELYGQYEDSTNAITRVDMLNGGSGDFAIGSQVIVLGHD